MQTQVFDRGAVSGRASRVIVDTHAAKDPAIEVYLLWAEASNSGKDRVVLATKLLAERGSEPDCNCEIEPQLRGDVDLPFAEVQPRQNTSAR